MTQKRGQSKLIDSIAALIGSGRVRVPEAPLFATHSEMREMPPFRLYLFIKLQAILVQNSIFENLDQYPINQLLEQVERPVELGYGIKALELYRRTGFHLDNQITTNFIRAAARTGEMDLCAKTLTNPALYGLFPSAKDWEIYFLALAKMAEPNYELAKNCSKFVSKQIKKGICEPLSDDHYGFLAETAFLSNNYSAAFEHLSNVPENRVGRSVFRMLPHALGVLDSNLSKCAPEKESIETTGADQNDADAADDNDVKESTNSTETSGEPEESSIDASKNTEYHSQNKEIVSGLMTSLSKFRGTVSSESHAQIQRLYSIATEQNYISPNEYSIDHIKTTPEADERAKQTKAKQESYENFIVLRKQRISEHIDQLIALKGEKMTPENAPSLVLPNGCSHPKFWSERMRHEYAQINP